MKTIIDFLPICIHTISGDGKILEMNPAGLKMLCKKLEDVVGIDYFSFVKEEDLPIIKKYWHEAVENGLTSRFNFRTVNDDLFSSCFSPIIIDGRVTKVVGFTFDLEESNRLGKKCR